MTIDVYKTLDYKPRFYLATRPEKAMGNTKSWQQAEKSLEKALKSTGVDFSIKPKEGAFYGPKIDIHILDSQKRDWQMATIQLDFQIPESMQLSYVDKDGAKKRPVMIHRGIFGSLERFIGILIEHTQGKLPLWLTPTQTIIMPITNKQNAYAKKVVTSLIKASIRSQLDERNETLQAKIRDAILQKIPYLVIVGEKEEKANLITVRTREGKNLEKQKVSSFINRLVKKIENKS